MKTKILSILALLLMTVTQGAWAQDSEPKLRIGSGTGTQTVLPFDNYYRYALSQQIYTVEELGTAGLIHSIDFYKPNTIECNRTLDIYMVSTAKSSFSGESDWIAVTAADLVFSGTVSFANNDWTTIELDKPFIYDGQQNVAIIIDDNTNGYNNNTEFYTFTPTTENQALYLRSDATNYDPTNPSSGTLTDSKNQIRILKEAIGDCMKPIGLAATGVTNNAATLTWRENGAATTWVIDYNGETVEVTDNPYTLTSLDAATVYTVKVRPACDENKWSATVTFTTLANNAAPYELTTTGIYANAATLNWSGVQDSYNVRYRTPSPNINDSFEDADEFAANWTVRSNNTENNVSGRIGRSTGYKHSGDYSFRFSSYVEASNKDYNQYLISHELSDAKSVDFYYCVHDSKYTETFKVGYSKTGNNVADFTWGDPISTSSTSWNHFEPLNLPDGVKYVAINYCTSSSYYYLYIDDMTIECGSAGEWVNRTNVTSPLDIDGLEQETKYEWQVQGIYNGEPTEWSTAATFTTTNEFKPATAVDLGLPSGTKWADMNVGAGSETGYGTYYAWNSSDIATAQWGNDWRMPTKAEAQELINNTDHEWATIGGVNGMKYMKKTDHSVYIFIPAAGWNANTNVGTKGTYWTSTTLEADDSKAYELFLEASNTTTGNDRKTYQFTVRPVQMFAGEGTESSPYLISSTTDWNNLSAAVNGGETYSGIYFKLTANISVTTMIGASDKPFRGSFDGGGHTLTVNYTASAAGTAPFSRTASTTLIKNLRVAGTITGGDFKVAGLVSEPAGATIEHCRVSATISANAYHGLWIGGFCNGGNVTIKNCLFDGKINCVGGGFIGYSETTSRINNCLFAPQTGSSLGSSQDGNGVFIYTKGRESNQGTITNCYYTSLAGGVAQGTDGSGMNAAQLVENLGPSNWKVVDGNAIPKVHPNLAGAGTQASPYLIASTTDWNNLVSAVNAGETYSGNYFKMTANVGTVETWMTGDLTTTGIFSGHFDGDGHTLTVNYSSDTQYCHPFGFLRGATIENLHVTGNITTSQTYAAGLAGRALSNSTNYITNCLVSTNITSTRSGTANICGVVMSVQANATLYIEGCAFTGSITSSNGTDNGGFSEWVTAGGTFSATNCLFAPSSVTDKSLENSSTFCRNGGTFTGCYFTRTLGTAQGLQARTIAAGANVTTLAISGAGTEYDVSGITAYAHGIKYNDVYYASNSDAVSLTLAAESRDGYRFKQYTTTGGTITAQTETSASLTMPDANVTISAEYDPFSGGTGTSVNPYQIASTADWNLLVSNVNAGETYSGNYFKMTANVGTVSTWMTGTFSGTFDGDGNTLTVDYDASTEGCAPFGTLSGATIQKLKVAGSISSNQKLVAGIAALCSSTGNNVTNCLVSATINSSYSDNAADGGLVAVVDNGASLNVTGCAFAGKLLTTNGTTSCGGIVGWRRPSGTVTITNCLYAPTSATGSETWIASADGENGNANFCRWNSSEPTITNCYYTTDFNSGDFTAQGLQARSIAAGDYVSTLSVTKGDATATYTVSGITVYSGGIDFNDGSTTTFYGGSGQTVSLALTHETPSGYQFKQYAASQGSLSGETTNTPTLTMPAANSTANDAVTISAEYDPTYNATFADASDASNGWSISPTSGIVGSTVTVRYEGENKVKSVTVAPKGALTGKFSVSSTKQVQFSKGNLQYDGSAWSFHTNQYDCVFTSISTATGYPMDIFCWGNIDNPAYDGSTGIGTNGVDLSGSSDWGSNTITNGCTGWRTLTLAEWEYLFANHSYGYATVAGQTGVIILPDVFTDPMRNNGSAAFAASTASWTANVYAAGDDWTAMEKAGALFLPAAGGRDGASIKSVGTKGSYWSSTADTVHGHFITFEAGSAPVTTYVSIHKYGKSVRLVKDVE